MKVTLVYNLKKDPKDECAPIDYYSEFDSMETIEAITSAIRSQGYEVSLAEANNQIIDRLLEQVPDIVFNIAEGSSGPNRESQIPAILDYLGIPYTGSDVLALALALNKGIAKRLFMHYEIPTPRFQVFKDKDAKLEEGLKFPLIVKPNCEGSAKGITRDSVVHNEARLYQEVEKVMAVYKQETLVEEFIDGKELTVGVLGNGKFLDLPILEIDFSNCRKSGEYFYSWRMKEYQGNEELGLNPQFYCPARLDRETARRVKETAYKVHNVLGCRDISRVDIRLSRENVPYVLEINPLPGLDPKESNFPVITRSSGMDYNKLIGKILELAIKRYKIEEFVKQKNSCTNRTTTYINPVENHISRKTEEGGKNVV